MAQDQSHKSFNLDALRDKATPQELDPEQAKEIVQKLNDEEAKRVPKASERRTYGRTQHGIGKFRGLRGSPFHQFIIASYPLGETQLLIRGRSFCRSRDS